MVKIIFFGVMLFSFSSYAIDLNKVNEQLKAQIEKQKQLNQQKQNNAQPAAAAVVAAPAAAPVQAAPSPTCNSQLRTGLCYMFTGADGSDAKKSKGNQMACKLMRGTYLNTGTCPSARAFGSCTILKGQPGEYILYYYPTAKLDKAKAEKDCFDSKSSIHRQGAGEWVALN